MTAGPVRLMQGALTTAGGTVVAGLCGLCLSTAPALAASTIAVNVQTATPEQGVPVQVSFSGAVPPGGGPDWLYTHVRPAGGIGCQGSPGADDQAAGRAARRCLS